MTPLSEWQNFYVIAGSSAGALIGLQFVVLTLIANLPRTPVFGQAAAAYTTPTIVHFGAVLFLSCLACAPWPTILPPAVFYVATGLAGLLYLALNSRRIRRASYAPIVEDWIFHAILPMAAYATLLAAGVCVFCCPRPALYAVAAAVVVLLLTGIHNAWDTVTYHVFDNRAPKPEK